MMDVLSASHTRYSIQYHFVWIVKYRQGLLTDPARQAKLRQVIEQIGERYWFELITLGTDGDHVHCFLRAAPRYAPARIMQILKSITAKELFRTFPNLRKTLWGGELWGDGYYVATVGDGVTADVIRSYIERQGSATRHAPFSQLKLF